MVWNRRHGCTCTVNFEGTTVPSKKDIGSDTIGGSNISYNVCAGNVLMERICICMSINLTFRLKSSVLAGLIFPREKERAKKLKS